MDSPLENVRHSLAHLLAAAVLELFPGTKQSIGPAIESGFYYDFDVAGKITEEDLPRIEEKMREILKTWKSFERKEVSDDEARAAFKDNPYKQELISDIFAKGEKLTLYTSGGYTDLCRGGHAEKIKDMDPRAFKLSHIAGAYWRGDSNNKMLTRIYGLAFASKKELAEYLHMIEEAKKRDHKKLGPELDLFTFSDLIGAGLPLWTPKGTVLRNLLDDFVWQLRKARGYMKVEIPHITKKELYEVSGHWEKYQDDLFKIMTREEHLFAMKPMNCPHHTQIYARRPWSYRDLPQRYANTTMVYRDEQTGELSGLSRARSFTQDDAHVFCRMSQAKDEALKIWDIVHEFYGAFGFALRIRLSTHDPEHPEKFLGDQAHWKVAEDLLSEIVKEKKVDVIHGLGEAAFYGPKLDFLAKDSLGREWQVATIQLDLNMPDRFDLVCTNEKSEKERIVMIHAAIMGSIERFLSILIEHTGGSFPAWLAPVQVTVLPISDKHVAYADDVALKLTAAGIRTEVNREDETIGRKIRAAELLKIPYLLVVGDKEVQTGAVAVRERHRGDIGQMPLEQFLHQITKLIAEKA